MDGVANIQRRRPAALLLMTLASLSWGAGIVMTKITLEQLAPLDVLAVELVVGAGVIWAVLFARGGAGPLSGWRGFALLGLLEPGLSFALGDFGLDMTGAAEGALLVASESLFAVVLARLVLNERLSTRAAVAVGVGFSGSLLVGIGQTGAGTSSLFGDALVLGASAAAGAYSVAARRIAARGTADAVTITAVQLLFAAIVSIPLVALGAAGGHSHIADADSAHLIAAVTTGLLSTAIPFLLFNVAIRDVEVAGAALIGNLIPVIGVGLAVVLLGESLAWLQVVGGAAIVLVAIRVREPAVADRCASP